MLSRSISSFFIIYIIPGCWLLLVDIPCRIAIITTINAAVTYHRTVIITFNFLTCWARESVSASQGTYDR